MPKALSILVFSLFSVLVNELELMDPFWKPLHWWAKKTAYMYFVEYAVRCHKQIDQSAIPIATRISCMPARSRHFNRTGNASCSRCSSASGGICQTHVFVVISMKGRKNTSVNRDFHDRSLRQLVSRTVSCQALERKDKAMDRLMLSHGTMRKIR